MVMIQAQAKDLRAYYYYYIGLGGFCFTTILLSVVRSVNYITCPLSLSSLCIRMHN